MEEEAKRNDGTDEQKWVYNSSVDYKGRVSVRASTGVWKASLFIITIEFSERLCYFGLSFNLISYLTNVLHQDLKTAAKNVNYWTGVTTVMPLAGGFIADAYLGRFTTVLISSFIYLTGLSLLTMSEFIPIIKPCNTGTICEKPRKIHEILFFIALYFISLGTGGYKPCLESFGADQFDDNHSTERRQKMSYFNWWNFALCAGLVLGLTVIAYVEDKLSWGIAGLILTVVMAVTILTFYAGKPYYRYRKPEGSPLTPLLKVLVAAIRKRKLPFPSDPSLLYEVPNLSHGRLLCHTTRLRFLDKAAIVDQDYETHNPWRLATRTKVEEMKLVLSTVPVWLTSLIFGVCWSQTSTFFVKQAATLDRKITDEFDIPPASIFCFSAIGMMVTITVYEKLLVPFLQKVTSNERGISILQRIGIGMIFEMASMVVAACVEMKRLKAVETGRSRMTVFWLAPQAIIHGVGDGFALVGLQEYFYEQVPDSMRSLGIAFFLCVIGVGSFVSSLLIVIVDHITAQNGKSWIGKDLSVSRLDNFYWVLAILILVNFCAYVLLTRRFIYKTVKREAVAVGVNGLETDGAVLNP